MAKVLHVSSFKRGRPISTSSRGSLKTSRRETRLEDDRVDEDGGGRDTFTHMPGISHTKAFIACSTVCPVPPKADFCCPEESSGMRLTPPSMSERGNACSKMHRNFDSDT
jgi:hypothetical protein